MKTIRHLLILVVAVSLVVGGTLAVAQWSGVSSGGGEGQAGLQSASADRPGFDSGLGLTRSEGGGDRDEGGAGGLVDVFKNAGVFGLLFVGVMLITHAVNRLTKRWPRFQTPKPTP